MTPFCTAEKSGGAFSFAFCAEYMLAKFRENAFCPEKRDRKAV